MCTRTPYEVDSCTECTIYAHPESDKVMRIIILSISSHMTEDEDETFRAYADSITGIFAADDEIDEMDTALAIADTPYTQATVNFFTGQDARFTYAITNGLLTVRILPPK